MSAAGGGINNEPEAAPVRSSFQQVVTNLEAFATDEWNKIKEGAIAIEQKLAPIIENTFIQLANDFGSLAVQTVVKFMSAEYAVLTGQEKQGGVVTTIVQAAEAAGKQVLISDAQALAKNAYVAVVGAQPPQ